MSKSKRKGEDARRKPLDLWQAPDGAGEPLICLATTFTFDAQFFEVECLGRFIQMDAHPSETEAVGYLIEREEKLASVRACVFADRRHAQTRAIERAGLPAPQVAVELDMLVDQRRARVEVRAKRVELLA